MNATARKLDRLETVTELWTDGGCVLKNPSPLAGTWAWCAVSRTANGHETRIGGDSGIVTPTCIGLPKVSNNVTELLAAIKALQWVPDGWRGKLFTDSRVTMLRLTCGSGLNGVPNWLRLQTLELRRSRKPEVILVAGHPTRKELAAGFRSWSGRCPESGLIQSSAGRVPVSRWNCWCDRNCRERAEEFLATMKTMGGLK